MKKNNTNQTCACGHDHHEHKHEEHSCGCGHEHHEHKHEAHSCGCGHDHHDHKHEHHDHDCGCGCCCANEAHDELGCGCGHDHGVANVKAEIVKICISAVMLLASMVILHFDRTAIEAWMYWAGVAVALAAYVICGYDTLIRSVKSLFGGSFSAIFNEDLLMSVATICAIVIGEYAEAAAVMVLFRLGELLQGLAVKRSRAGIRAALELCADTANVLGVDGDISVCDPRDVAVGTRILVRPGERIPLDGQLLDGLGLVNYAAITGEAVPVPLEVGASVLSGGIVINSPLTLITTAEFGDSTAARILRTVEDAQKGKPRLESFIRRFAKVYTPIVMLCAVLLAAVPSLFGWGLPYVSAADWVHRALLFLVVSCPCALVISVPLTFFSGLSLGAREGVLFKSADMLESLAKVRAMAFDKTGTLTDGSFRVSEVVPHDAHYGADELLGMAAALEAVSLHPIARAIHAAGESGGYTAQDVTEKPGLGIAGTVDGKKLFAGNERYMAQLGIGGIAAPEGVTTVIYLAENTGLIGELRIEDSIRDGAKAAVEYLRTHGRHTALLTGDSENAAATVGARLGIGDIRARLMPEDKLAAIIELRKEHGSVAFLGDGTNDAPVLAGSDVGLVMGAMGTDAAIESGDVLIMGDDIRALPKAFEISKRITATARLNIALALTIKLAAMVLGVMGLLEMWMAVIADVGATLICVLIAAAAARRR